MCLDLGKPQHVPAQVNTAVTSANSQSNIAHPALVKYANSASAVRFALAIDKPKTRACLISAESTRNPGITGNVKTTIIPFAKLLCEYSDIFCVIFSDPSCTRRLSYPMMFTHTTIIMEQNSNAN